VEGINTPLARPWAGAAIILFHLTCRLLPSFFRARALCAGSESSRLWGTSNNGARDPARLPNKPKHGVRQIEGLINAKLRDLVRRSGVDRLIANRMTGVAAYEIRDAAKKLDKVIADASRATRRSARDRGRRAIRGSQLKRAYEVPEEVRARRVHKTSPRPRGNTLHP
jgi:hypothetical protein